MEFELEMNDLFLLWKLSQTNVEGKFLQKPTARQLNNSTVYNTHLVSFLVPNGL